MGWTDEDVLEDKKKLRRVKVKVKQDGGSRASQR